MTRERRRDGNKGNAMRCGHGANLTQQARRLAVKPSDPRSRSTADAWLSPCRITLSQLLTKSVDKTVHHSDAFEKFGFKVLF
jgi:hypothetical protein